MFTDEAQKSLLREPPGGYRRVHVWRARIPPRAPAIVGRGTCSLPAYPALRQLPDSGPRPLPLPVRRAGGLPAASFRPHLAAAALAVRL